ncbi:fatty acid desaturase [Aestuariivirga litoralis]|uniref:fatty acid desaturase n=1 Tax=Aestuariivirga litoralis TaxID=2650924 RepID=UPI001FF025B4|nr:fatty acid desaturase [Aestuariivirga litoralis]
MNSPAPARISAQASTHNHMRKAALRENPRLSALPGAFAPTALALPVLLALHWSVAWVVGQTNLLICFLAAFCVGQFIIHSGGALLHETAHRLVFHRDRPKLVFDLALELLLGSFGKQLTYQFEHVTSHHAHLGDYERDYEHEDVCAFGARQKIRSENPRMQNLLTGVTLLFGLLPFGFLLGDYVLPRLYEGQSGRGAKDHARNIRARQVPKNLRLAFVLTTIVLNVFLFWAFGFLGWLYHNWSLSIFLGKMGISNLGQSLSEHEGDNDAAPTFSDYRAQNLILFNTGYHNEHHTFPNVAWVNLPGLRRGAPGIFNRQNPLNYAQLWLRHVRADFSPSRRNAAMKADNTARCAPKR